MGTLPLPLLLNLLSILIDSGEGRGVAVYGGGRPGGREKTDPYMRCYGLDVIKEKACFKEVDKELAPLLPWWAWLLIGIAAVALTLGLCWLCCWLTRSWLPYCRGGHGC